MNKRLIYAEDVLTNIDRDRAYMSDVGRIHAKAAVNDAPTVDAKPVVRGEWIEDYETFVHDNGYESEPIQIGYICSECGNNGLPNWQYCPYCGADMRGAEDGN